MSSRENVPIAFTKPHRWRDGYESLGIENTICLCQSCPIWSHCMGVCVPLSQNLFHFLGGTYRYSVTGCYNEEQPNPVQFGHTVWVCVCATQSKFIPFLGGTFRYSVTKCQNKEQPNPVQFGHTIWVCVCATQSKFVLYFREELLEAIRGKGGFQGLRKVMLYILSFTCK